MEFNNYPPFSNLFLLRNIGALNTTGAYNLFIAGDFNITSSNSDPLNIGSQTVTFNGSGDQTLALNDETLFDVVVNKPNGKVTLTQPVNLLNQLVLQSASEFASNGYLKMISTSDGASGNAMIGVIPDGGVVTGDVSVQRYISGEGNLWRYISSPVTNATVADWQDDFPITGMFSDPSTGPGINSSVPSLYLYGESGSGGNLLLGWTAFPTSGTTTSNSIIPGAGYTALMLNGSNPTVVEVSGPINQGVFGFNVSFAGSGWNLLGNPYPATIDWSSGNGWSSSNVANAIYIRNNENGNSNSIVASFVDGIGTNGGTGLVATGGYLNLDFASISENNVVFSVYNTLGKLQFSKSLDISHQRSAKVDFAEMVPGIYLAKMIVEDKSYFIKIIK